METVSTVFQPLFRIVYQSLEMIQEKETDKPISLCSKRK
jgi:hypothetical protein